MDNDNIPKLQVLNYHILYIFQLNKNHMNILKQEIINFPCIYSKELIFLCKKLLTKDIKNRPYIWELKNYDFLKRKNDSFKNNISY